MWTLWGIPRWHASGQKSEVEVSQESRERLRAAGALIEIDIRGWWERPADAEDPSERLG
jgi:hypothetical protein